MDQVAPARLLAAIACCASLLPAAQPDPWVLVRSPHFELFTTAGEAGGRDLLEYLEHVRAFFLEAFDVAGSRSRPVQVICFRTDAEYRPYRPIDVADAFFQPGAGHDFIVMKDNAGDYPTAVHEYIHLLLRRTRIEVPRWLNEGVAELYSNLQPAGTRIVVGQPIPNRLQALEREPWINLRALLAPGPLPAGKNRAAVFYAESWALVHMLSLDGRYSPRLRLLLTNLQKGDAAAAFEATYGKPLERVQQDLRSYVRGAFLNTAVFSLPPPAAANAVRVEAGASLNARLALVELLWNERADAPRAISAYRSLAREFENRWEVEAAWGEFCARERRGSEAADHFSRAAGLGSDDSRMYLDYARVLNRLNRAEQATANLRTAVRLDPALDDARFELAIALVQAGSSREGIDEFHRIRQLDQDFAYPYFYYLAVAHSTLGDTAQARRLIDRGRSEARSTEEAAALDRLSETLTQPAKP